MAVQFNLLPDVKLEFNRSQALKKLIYTLSSLAVVVVLVITTLSFVSVSILQKKLLSDADKDIELYSQRLKDIPDIEKVLTIQNQLKSLPGLHDSKHYSSRLFTYLPQLLPADANIGRLALDTTGNTLSISGTADTVRTVNKFVDTLKFTNYVTSTGTNEQMPAFTSVVLSQIDRNDKEASYTVDTTYDPALFDATQSIALKVPKIITTRSVINTPDVNKNPLFDGQTDEEDQEEQ